MSNRVTQFSMEPADDDGWDFGTVRQSLPPAPKPTMGLPSSAASSRYSLNSYAGSTTQSILGNERRPLPASPSGQLGGARPMSKSPGLSRTSDSRVRRKMREYLKSVGYEDNTCLCVHL